jgi:esterase/lipase superfamily enzyme
MTDRPDNRTHESGQAQPVGEDALATTVYFATNRVVVNASDPNWGYTSTMVPPLKPEEITYGTAIVDGIDVASNEQGFVSEIKDTKQGSFSDKVLATLPNPGTDMLVFIHGFDNTFSDALTRAAFNREWLAASGLPGTSTTVVAFSWPSTWPTSSRSSDLRVPEAAGSPSSRTAWGTWPLKQVW